MSIIQISAIELQNRLQAENKPLLLDVREPNEFSFAHIEGSLHIPLHLVPLRINELDSDADWVVICHHGMRSQQAAQFLHRSGFAHVYNLRGGIDAWSIECNNTVSRY